MVLADHLRKTLLEPLKERQRMEGWKKGFDEGFAKGREEERAKWLAWNEGRKKGCAESNARWRAWNGRREKAAERGEPFNESPPGMGG